MSPESAPFDGVLSAFNARVEAALPTERAIQLLSEEEQQRRREAQQMLKMMGESVDDEKTRKRLEAELREAQRVIAMERAHAQVLLLHKLDEAMRRAAASLKEEAEWMAQRLERHCASGAAAEGSLQLRGSVLNEVATDLEHLERRTGAAMGLIYRSLAKTTPGLCENLANGSGFSQVRWCRCSSQDAHETHVFVRDPRRPDDAQGQLWCIFCPEGGGERNMSSAQRGRRMAALSTLVGAREAAEQRAGRKELWGPDYRKLSLGLGQ